MLNVANRTLFTGDNLDVMRGINSECIDLIYLDPPFNSNANYAAPIGSEAAGAAFKDTWALDDVDLAWHGQIADDHPGMYGIIDAAGECHGKSMKAYLIMMGVRLLEMKRLLKPTGSIYLHCDPTASHYLKMVMDSIFGQIGYKNEIVWKRSNPKNDAKRFGNDGDRILFYTCSEKSVWNTPFQPLSPEYVKTAYRYRDDGGPYRLNPLHAEGLSGGGYEYEWNGHFRVWRYPEKGMQELEEKGLIHYSSTGLANRKFHLGDSKGKPAQSIWTDIAPVDAQERLGYPTQKPLKLLERIIETSSDVGQSILDPFCGCATACVAAEQLHREWLGIDLSQNAANLVQRRLSGHTGLFGKITHRTDIPVRTDVYQMKHYSNFKNELYGRQEGKCNGCKVLFPFRNMTIDHIIPRSKGGQDNDENLQLLCGACNSMKGNRDMPYLLAKLQKMEARN